MKMNIETYVSNNYKVISKEYGKVLTRFGLVETEDGNAEIYIGCLGDLLSLSKELEEFTNSSDRPFPYFGLMIKAYDDGTPYLEIKDDYDWKTGSVGERWFGVIEIVKNVSN